MLNTDKAWKVFEKMGYTFFLFSDGDFKNIAKAKVLKDLARVAKSDELRDELIRKAAKLLTNADFVK